MGPKRKDSKKKKTEGLKTDQLEDYLFTPAGHALKHGLEHRQRHQKIITHNFSSTPWRTIINEEKKRGNGKDSTASLSRTSFEYTDEELDDSDMTDGQYKCLVVGMAILPKLDEPVTGLRRGQGVGVELPDKEFIYHVPDKFLKDSANEDDAAAAPKKRRTSRNKADPDCFLVVTPTFSRMPAGGIKLYVLLNQEDGLCHPYNIAGKDVFYFHEYRDECTAKASRSVSWANKITPHAISADGDADDDNDGVERPARTAYGNAKDLATVMVNPEVAFANEMTFLTAAFALNQDDWILNELKRVMEEGVSGLGAVSKDYNHMRLFLVLPVADAAEGASKPGDARDSRASKAKTDRTTDDVDMEKHSSSEDETGSEDESEEEDSVEEAIEWDPKEMLGELAEVWPEARKGMTVRLLTELRKGIVESRAAIPFAHYEGFLRMAVVVAPATFKASSASTQVQWILKCVAAARCDEDEAPSRVSIAEQGASGALITALLNKLRALKSQNAASVQAIKDGLGNKALPESPAQLWSTFGDAIDTDTARLAWDLAQGFLAQQMANKSDVLESGLTSIIEALDALHLEGKKKRTTKKKKKTDDDDGLPAEEEKEKKEKKAKAKSATVKDKAKASAETS